jgi:hypothetical protein
MISFDLEQVLLEASDCFVFWHTKYTENQNERHKNSNIQNFPQTIHFIFISSFQSLKVTHIQLFFPIGEILR